MATLFSDNIYLPLKSSRLSRTTNFLRKIFLNKFLNAVLSVDLLRKPVLLWTGPTNNMKASMIGPHSDLTCWPWQADCFSFSFKVVP